MVLPTEEKALRVVVPIDRNQLHFRVVMNREDGVCDTRRIHMEGVFYFPEFRDVGMTIVLQRGKTRNRKVNDQIRIIPSEKGGSNSVFTESGIAATREHSGENNEPDPVAMELDSRTDLKVMTSETGLEVESRLGLVSWWGWLLESVPETWQGVLRAPWAWVTSTAKACMDWLNDETVWEF